MKVRVIEMVGGEYFDDYKRLYHLEDMTEWCDVNQDELDGLYLWAKEMNCNSFDLKIVIITEKMFNQKKAISEYLEKANKIKEELDEKERKRKAQEEKRRKRRELSLVKRKEKAREKKLKLLAKLKAELKDEKI